MDTGFRSCSGLVTCALRLCGVPYNMSSRLGSVNAASSRERHFEACEAQSDSQCIDTMLDQTGYLRGIVSGRSRRHSVTVPLRLCRSLGCSEMTGLGQRAALQMPRCYPYSFPPCPLPPHRPKALLYLLS